MSNTDLDVLTKERDSLIAQLKKQETDAQGQLESVQCQLEGHGGMLNESIQQNLTLRTNLQLFNRANKKLSEKVQAFETTVASQMQTIKDLTASNAALQAKIDELSKPVLESLPVSDEEVAA
jgi:chromosome segregation ATPase